MTTFTKYHGDFFYRSLVAVAMIGPILLVIAAGTLPEGLDRSHAAGHPEAQISPSACELCTTLAQSECALLSYQS